jgi:PKD repeat protein
MKTKYLFFCLCIICFAAVGCKKEPVACFTLDFTGASVTGNADCSVNAESYTWNFGDGFTSISIAPTHVYDTTGVYQVSLRVENKGESDTQTQSITIY